MSLLKRLIIGGCLAIAGSWFIVGLRLSMTRNYFSLAEHEPVSFILDFIGFSAVIFGCLTAVSALPDLWRRLQRLQSLGEHDW
jgi:TRAP-type C4-dicarboxylate transport system permease small subunit